MARGWTLFESLCVSVGGTLHSIGDFGRHLTLHCPLRRPWLSGKTTGAYLLPSAGLSTAHLHIDGKSMGSLQCTINITNDQFKLALAVFLALTAARAQGWTVMKKVLVQPPQGWMHIQVKLHVTMWDNAAGHVGEWRQSCRQPYSEKRSWINETISQEKDLFELFQATNLKSFVGLRPTKEGYVADCWLKHSHKIMPNLLQKIWVFSVSTE